MKVAFFLIMIVICVLAWYRVEEERKDHEVQNKRR